MSQRTFDQELLSGNFLYNQIPQGKEYLFRYFDKPMEKRILVYWLNVGQYFKSIWRFHKGFIEHTGRCCSTSYVYTIVTRIVNIEQAVAKATEIGDLQTLSDIKLGNWKRKK